MPEPRIYDTQESCPVARTLNVVGDRWTILVLRELSWGRKRYSKLLEALEGISTNLLADRLKKLEKEHELSEDDTRHKHDAIQKLTDSFVHKVDEAVAAKEKDILEI